MYNHIFLDPCPRKSTEKLAVKVYPWSPQSLKNTWHGTGVCLKIRYPNIHWLILINHHYISLFEWQFCIAQFQTHPNILWLLYTPQLYPNVFKSPWHIPWIFQFQDVSSIIFRPGPPHAFWLSELSHFFKAPLLLPFKPRDHFSSSFQNFEAICGFLIGVPSGNLT